MGEEKRLVLIVDDSQTMRLLLRKALEVAGFAVIDADSGEKAILLFQEHHPDAILLDVEMSGINGFVTCSEIRKLPGGQYLPIMMVTGLDDLESINSAYQAGATDFVTKPINWDIIGYRVRYIVRTHQDFIELQKSKVRLANAQQLARLGTWDWDIQKNEIYWSEELVNITNKKVTCFNSAEDHLLDIVHPEDKSLLKEAITKCIELKALYMLEYRIILPTGEIRFLQEKTDILYDRANFPTSIFGTIQDITSLKRAENEIRMLNAELEQRVIQRTEQLEKANQELQDVLNHLKETQAQLIESEKMASLGGLVAGIAHEVNTPLGIGVTAVSHLKEKLDVLNLSFGNNTLKRSELSAFLQDCNESTRLLQINLNRASELIKSFKQVSADRTHEEPREFNLKNYLEEIILSLQPELKKNQLKIGVDCPNDIIITSWPGAFSQVLTILVMNSIQHGYEVNQRGILRITVKCIEDKIELIYSDDGKGIVPENIKKIFEPFFTTKRGAGGIGLGLHIAYNIVVQTLKGTIQCQSELGKGATFIITLPHK